MAEVSITSAKGIDLIKSFEGLRLQCYTCSSGVLTVGYGHTGPDVYQGLVITKERAWQLLVEDLHRFERAVRQLFHVPLTQQEFDAIVSFAFNVGTGVLENSTFRKRMNAGENKATCFNEEFPKWVRGPNGPLPGLVRRRQAEVAMANSTIQ